MPFSRTHDVVSLSLSIEPPIQDFNGATRRVAQAILAQQRGREGYGPSAVTSASEQASKRIETIYTWALLTVGGYYLKSWLGHWHYQEAKLPFEMMQSIPYL